MVSLEERVALDQSWYRNVTRRRLTGERHRSAERSFRRQAIAAAGGAVVLGGVALGIHDPLSMIGGGVGAAFEIYLAGLNGRAWLVRKAERLDRDAGDDARIVFDGFYGLFRHSRQRGPELYPVKRSLDNIPMGRGALYVPAAQVTAHAGSDPRTASVETASFGPVGATLAPERSDALWLRELGSNGRIRGDLVLLRKSRREPFELVRVYNPLLPLPSLYAA